MLGIMLCGASDTADLARSFAEVIALVGKNRDAKLKLHLVDHISLVKFDAAAGSIRSGDKFSAIRL